MSAQSQFSNPCDYELKYPRDNEEFWLAYLDEAKVWDRDMVNAWNGTLNRFLLCVSSHFPGIEAIITVNCLIGWGFLHSNGYIYFNIISKFAVKLYSNSSFVNVRGAAAYQSTTQR